MKETGIRNILILGGSGFIGTNLILDLINKDLNLFVYDKNISPGLKEIYKNHNVKKLQRDFVKEKNFESFLKDIDCIIHLIHSSIPLDSNKNVVLDIESNLIPSVKLFEIAITRKVKKIIYISSGGKIYGARDKLIPIKETSIKEPIYSYEIMKLAIEKYLRLVTDNSETKFMILRPSNPYGENYFYSDRSLGLINVSLLKLMFDKVLTIWGDGKNIRDYIYIKDLTGAIVKSIFLKQKENYTLNIGTGVGKSILEILALIESILNKKVKFSFIESRKIDINYNVLNIEKAKTILDWEPKIKIEDGIKKTWDWLNSSYLNNF